ncbi:MAG: InlB B-repeat-containing protein [Oscillospiraceae bacterium]|nr:InlB B-repeat-containing protein [Oscillospiraceae bacterium]
MPLIDNRLLDCSSEPEITENFNRVLSLLDSAVATMSALSGSISDLSGDMAGLSGLSGAVATLGGITTRTVTFDSDGGTEIAAQVVVYGGVATLPEAPTKEGNTFVGWFSGETEYIFTTEVKADVTLTAHWTAE